MRTSIAKCRHSVNPSFRAAVPDIIGAVPPRPSVVLIPTLPLQIADRIGARIVEEEAAPGARLKEVELAAEFGVSRASVREALRILEKRGLVTILPQRGAQVTRLSAKELEDLFEIRSVMLGLASRRVAQAADAGTRRALGERLEALVAARRSAPAYARASAAMVAEIARRSGNLQLEDYIASYAQRFGRYARLGLATQARRERSIANWRRLMRAIAAGDGALAETVHRRLAMENLEAGLAEIARRSA